jgi:hypothetical protein
MLGLGNPKQETKRTGSQGSRISEEEIGLKIE